MRSYEYFSGIVRHYLAGESPCYDSYTEIDNALGVLESILDSLVEDNRKLAERVAALEGATDDDEISIAQAVQIAHDAKVWQ